MGQSLPPLQLPLHPLFHQSFQLHVHLPPPPLAHLSSPDSDSPSSYFLSPADIPSPSVTLPPVQDSVLLVSDCAELQPVSAMLGSATTCGPVTPLSSTELSTQGSGCPAGFPSSPLHNSHPSQHVDRSSLLMSSLLSSPTLFLLTGASSYLLALYGVLRVHFWEERLANPSLLFQTPPWPPDCLLHIQSMAWVTVMQSLPLSGFLCESWNCMCFHISLLIRH